MNNSIIIDFSHLLENPEGYNVKIIVGEEPNVKEFKAHSLILTNRSAYFKSALSSQWAKVENGITIFNKPNISPLVFEVLLKYFYTGIISVENKEISLVDIAIAGDELQLLEVYQQLEERLLVNKLAWKPRDIITIFQHDHFTTLYNFAIELVCKNPKIIFESEDFFEMKEIHLINLLKCDELELEEIKIWEYLIQWGIKNTDSILDYNLTNWTSENFMDLKNTLFYQQLEERLLVNKLAWKPRDIITIFQHDHFTTLYNFAIELVCKNPKIIFESEDFFEMKEIHLINLLKCDELELEEIKIWEYLIQWGIKNTDSILDYNLTNWTSENFMDLKNTLCNCIPHIRFFQMSPGDYAEVKAHFKDFLPNDDEITQYFLNPNSGPSVNILPSRGYPFESKIINAKDAGLIASWIDKRRTPYNFKDLPFKFELIYRASREGFEINNFHNNCDNKGPTVVVIKVRDSGEIIGGYNPLEWCHFKIEDERSSLLSHNNDFDHQCKSSNSFIFSLEETRLNIGIARFVKEEAIIWCRNKGPCFGLQDLRINSSDLLIISLVKAGNTLMKRNY
ncbi:hypothetical protein Glove_58g68 [Diversispora epigaea]|uniref:BTB domain-containing protein n=1 Tax=Diversispora epigaea TaxID=1348612 RepID=A0A397JLZ6_9GLOM|nr:hypothetical protein Glove_58g68 [Diversispora epigaea]